MTLQRPIGSSVQWHAAAEDPAGRLREVIVTSERGRVAVSPPPGEGFSMNADEADNLALAILAASNRARRHETATQCA